MKKCLSCGAQLPEGARACPQCGTFVPDPGSGPDAFNLPTVSSSSGMIGPTVSAAPYKPSQQPPSSYGADVYGTPPPPSYDPYRVQGGVPPYGANIEYAPPPPQSASPYPTPSGSFPFVGGMQQVAMQPRWSQGRRIALIAGIVILAVILVGEGIFLLVPAHPSPGPVTQGTATPAPQSNQDPYGTFGGTLVLSDPMHDNSKGYKWDETVSNDPQGNGQSACSFSAGAYHLTDTIPGDGMTCNPEASSLVFSDVVMEANLTILKGYQSGLFIRVDQANVTGYLFFIDTNGGYSMVLVNHSALLPTDRFKVVQSGTNAAIKKGLKQANLVALAAKGNTISAYVNNTFMYSLQDSTFHSGQIGVYAANAVNQQPCDIVVSNVRVWKL